MLRYVLAILLINTCYHSLGSPVRTTSKQISVSILILINNCENAFLKNLLNSRIKECTDIAPPYKTKQLQCLMLYDMGTQLCTAVNASGITLNEDYTSKINEETDVNSLCETAKDWVFTDFLEYRSYKNIIEKIYKHPVFCGKICGSDELTNDDANFFCKFYKWGWELVKSHENTTSLNSTSVGEVVQSLPNAVTKNTNKSVDSIPSGKESMDISIKSTTFNDKPKEIESSSVPLEKVSGSSNVDTKQILSEVVTTNNQTTHQFAPKIEKIEETQVGVKNPEEQFSSVALGANVVPSIENVEKENQNKNVSSVPLSDMGRDDLKIEPEHKESVLESPKDNALIESEHDVDDEFNSEEKKEENDDINDDEEDGSDPMIGNNIKPSHKNIQTESKIDSVASIVNKEISEREFYSGNAQDVGADDDDHFFTFFLTAIVLVVLLYILYHDKSKISKLFFGLLLEGRQNGRRRNSRGHAYRRLDTLEQAMSTNTAAPPSKIIY